MRSVGSFPLAVPASTNTRLRMSPVPANRCLYSKRSLRPKPPIVWLSFGTNVSAGCVAMASRSFFSSRSMAFLPSGGSNAVGIEEDVNVF